MITWTLGGGLDELVRLLVKLLGDVFLTDVAPPAGGAAPGATRQETSGTAFVLGYALGAGFATDEAQAGRGLGACDYYVASTQGQSDPQATLASGIETADASVGHPNPLGAAEYVRAIQAVLGA